MNTEENLIEEAQEPTEQPAAEETPEEPRTHVRAGITKNHNRGQSKRRRKMANESRRINRRSR
jgi:hypothetical protein